MLVPIEILSASAHVANIKTSVHVASSKAADVYRDDLLSTSVHLSSSSSAGRYRATLY